MRVRPADLWRVARSGVTAGATLFLAFVAWELVKFLAQRYAARTPVLQPGAEPEDEASGAVPSTASRLRTLLPVMRIAMAVVIVVLTILIVLSELGVNIA